MKKISSAAAHKIENIEGQRLTVGLDLGDRSSWYCVLNDAGARLEQVKGVGTLIALTYLLTLKDPRRFRQSRDVGCYVGLQPGRRNSGQSEPQLHISKEGDPYLRTRMVQSAPRIQAVHHTSFAGKTYASSRKVVGATDMIGKLA